MNKLITTTISIFILLLSGCATAPSGQINGNSLANKKLKSDTYNMVAMYTSAQGCKSIDEIEADVVKKPSGEPGGMSWKERWIAYGCNKQFPYKIDFTEDGSGGAYFSVTAD